MSSSSAPPSTRKARSRLRRAEPLWGSPARSRAATSTPVSCASADFGGEGLPLLVLAIPETGHRVAEQAIEEMAAMLTGFPAPYRENGGGLR